MVNKWTPGPWRINTTGVISNQIEADSRQRFCDSDDGYRGVALFQACCDSRKYADEDENKFANAHLIAAAPDLYEALSECRLLLDGEGGMPVGVRERADAALARARGEAQ